MFSDSGDEELGKCRMTKIGDDSRQLLQDIKELEKQIDEDASITRLQEKAVLIEARVQKVTARGADGPPTTTNGVCASPLTLHQVWGGRSPAQRRGPERHFAATTPKECRRRDCV